MPQLQPKPYNKFEEHNINELLDKRASAAKAKKFMNDFCKRWRAKRGATSGGITANTVQLLWALLKILPASMEAIRVEQPELFEECMELGEFCLFTNKTILARKMLEEDGNTFTTIEACKKTIYNQLERLQDEDLNIITYKMRYNKKGEPSQTGNGQFLLYINPEILVFYPTKEEILQAVAEAKTDQNGPDRSEELKNVLHSNYNNTELLKTLDNRLAPVDKVSTSVDDSQLSNFEMQSTANKSNLEAYAKKVQQKILQKEKNAHSVGVLWSQAYENLYKGELFTSEMTQLSKDLLESHLEGMKTFVQDVRSSLMQQWIQSQAFQNLPKNDKIRHKARQWMHRRLPDIDRKAFEILSRAIQIQKENIAQKGYKIYNPKVYFSMDYGFHKAVYYAKKEYKNLLRYNAKDGNLATHNSIKTYSYSAVSGIVFALQRTGIESALALYKKHYNSLREKLLNSTLGSKQRRHYLQRFQDQINHIFVQTKSK